MKYLIGVWMVLALSACQQTVVTPKPVVATIDVSLLRDCRMSPPPERERYLQATWEERTALLNEVLRLNYEYLGECNIRLKAAREQQEALQALENQ